jgi:hypothetical protein
MALNNDIATVLWAYFQELVSFTVKLFSNFVFSLENTLIHIAMD